MTRFTIALAAVCWAAPLSGQAQATDASRSWDAQAEHVCQIAKNAQEQQLELTASETTKLDAGLRAGDPAARAQYARLLTLDIRIHARMNRRLARIDPPPAFSERYRAMIAIDRLRYGPDAVRVAALYRQPSSPDSDAEIKRLVKRSKARDKRYKRAVIRSKTDGCGAVD